MSISEIPGPASLPLDFLTHRFPSRSRDRFFVSITARGQIILDVLRVAYELHFIISRRLIIMMLFVFLQIVPWLYAPNIFLRAALLRFDLDQTFNGLARGSLVLCFPSELLLRCICSSRRSGLKPS